MIDNKLIDKEIIKALECCADNQHCWLCVLRDRENDCYELEKSALDLINRQQAKIERLEYEIMKTKLEKHLLNETVEEIKSEAIKEFAERLRSHYDQYDDYDDIYAHHIRDDIDFTLDDMIRNTERKKIEDEKDT